MTHIISDISADGLGVEVYVEGHVHAGGDVAVHGGDGEVGQEPLDVPPEPCRRT